jgi:uncharacterized protein YutE (UPF0331/DUF86 family)/predicted nucleotidyltransferase
MSRRILLSILLLLGSSHARAQISRNGGFERPRYIGALDDSRPFYFYTRTKPLDDWTITGSSLAFLRSRPPYWRAAEGDQFIELESGFGFAISQTLPTVPAERYTIRYAWAPNPDAPGADDALEVWWDGTLIARHDGSDPTVETLDWTFVECVVTATGASSVIRFQDGFVGIPCTGPFLDAVMVLPDPRVEGIPLPEPELEPRWPADRRVIACSTMSHHGSDELASRLTSELSALPEVELAYLFGSHAQNRTRAESDIDLAVQVDPAAAPRQTLAMLFDHLGRVVPSDRLDIVLLNVAPSLLRHRILATGRLLFERSPLVRVRFVTRTIRDYQDMQLRRAFFLKHRVQRLKQGGTDGGSGDLLAQARRVRGHLEKLRAFQRTSEREFIDSPAIHDLAERYLHLATECVLDLGNHFIAEQGLPSPDTNQDTFTRLEQARAITPELAGRLRAWAGFRNILVHQYLDIDHGIAWHAIQDDLGDLEALAQWATDQL